MYQIDVDVPIPPHRMGRARAHNRPMVATLRALEVGQSFFAPNIDSARVVTAATTLLKPKRFVTRMVDGGVRVWRAE